VFAGSFAPRWLALAQEAPRPSFEVASVKPGDPSSRQFGIGVRASRFITTNATLKMMIGFAYDVRDHQISGGPNWLNSEAFTIEAKPPAGTAMTPEPRNMNQLRLMLQSLLQERFKLTLHHESRMEQVYELVVAKGGHRMKETAPDPKGRQGIFSTVRNNLNGFAAPTGQLANILSQTLGRSVIDKTGLAGKYDFKLVWTPGPGEGVADPLPDAPAPVDASGPSLFTAIQEQLGLKLESAKGAVDVLVIDHVAKPDEN
jgi:uncharacterized protein (TIGR03435 family)